MFHLQCPAGFVGLKQVRQITPTVHDADDLDPVDRTLVGVGVRFEENEIRPFDEDARTRANIGAARPEPGEVRKPSALASIAVHTRSAAAGLSRPTMT
jgi:hypothetical protein